MKKLYLTIVLLLVFFFSQAQIVDIPDANFKWALVNWGVASLGNGIFEDVDTNDDGEIQISEAEAVIGLYVWNWDIESIEGIESFINILELGIGENNISNMDLSQNTSLEYLAANHNQFVSIDISNNINLEIFQCYNNQLTSIDVTQNLNLLEIDCDFNLISEIDISNNLILEGLYSSPNLIQTIDLTNNQGLKYLNVSSNNLFNIDVSQNLQLVYLNCEENRISELDVSNNTNLETLHSEDNQLTSLNIKNGYNENLTVMCSTGNPELSCIEVDDVDYANQSSWDIDPWAEYSEVCTLGIEDTELSSNFNIYPNPVNDHLTLDNTSTSQITSIKVYDATGRLVLDEEGNTKQLDMSSLNSGLLFIKIETDEGVLTKKIIKE